MYSYDPKYSGSTCCATLNPIKETMYAVNRGSNGASNSSERTKKGSAIISHKIVYRHHSVTPLTVQPEINTVDILRKPVTG